MNILKTSISVAHKLINRGFMPAHESGYSDSPPGKKEEDGDLVRRLSTKLTLQNILCNIGKNHSWVA